MISKEHIEGLKEQSFDSEVYGDELQCVQEKYKSIFERRLHCIYTHDLEGNFLEANDAALKLLGYSREELLSLNFSALIEEDNLALAVKTADEIMRTGFQQEFTEYQLKRKDGSFVWVETDGSLINKNGKPNAILGVARDITARKKTEKALKESEANYKQIVDHAPAGIYEVDLATMKFTRVNDIVCRVSGYSREELLSMNPEEIITDKSKQRLAERAGRLSKGQEIPGRAEYQIKTKDGRKLWALITSQFIYENGKAVRATVVISDIDDQKKTEAALRLSEEKYRLLVENANDAIFILQEGQIKFSNRKAKSIGENLGIGLERVPFDNYIHPDDRDMIIDRHRRRLKGETLPNAYSFRLVGKDGQEMWVEINTVRVDWNGKPATLNFLRDITLQRKLEHQLQISQKMEAVGTLAGGIAHDFNNLLMGIQGRTSLMLLETERVHPFYEHLKETENYVMRAAELTRQLLGFARGGKYEVKPTDLNELVHQSIRMFGRTKKEVSIKAKYQEHLKTVEVDRSQIDQVLLNIYVNAWQAMPEGGILYVQTSNVDLDENFVSAYGVRPGKYAAISITDTGIGMDEQIAKRVFDPFFTTKEKDRGTGLGLASAYGIIKNHDGIITVESTKGQGAVFSVYLPASDKDIIEEKQSEQEILTGSETVLLVDDEELILDVGVQMLKKMGYRVLTASHGDQAIEIYRRNKEPIAIVILDLVMPQISGGEIYDRLKAIDSNVKVLLSSGYSVDGQATEILNRGCDGFIQKPFRLDELSKKIRTILTP
jgi:PAS domain S-box-containing protein